MKGFRARLFVGICMLACFLPFLALAQQSSNSGKHITGKIIDTLSSKPVPYVSITLLDGQRKKLRSTFSAEEGTFAFEISQAGDYVLQLSAVSYSSKEIPVTVLASQTKVVVPDILFSPTAGALQEVVVTSKKKLIEVRPGMLVYNAANDATNKGGTAADVLRKAPVLNVDAQGNVSMRGSSNLKILVNGKYSGQMARSPADALNMMPADIIQSVEVITTPSARYDAEGAAGVINIITKKGRKDISGALELSASNLEQVFNPRIAINTGKWSIAAHGHAHRLRFKEASVTNRTQFENGQPAGQLFQKMEKDNAAPHGSGDLAISFQPDSVSEFTAGVNAWFGNWPDDRNMETIRRLPNGSIAEHYFQSIHAREKYLGADINLGYNRKFRNPGQEITLLAQFSPSKSKEPYETWLSDKTSQPYYQEINDNHTRNKEWTFQADYVHPLAAEGKYILESGVKLIFRDVNNRYSVLAGDPLQPPGLQPDPTRSDNFSYNQDVWGAYALLKSNLNNNWYAELGVRVEGTRLKGVIAGAATNFSNHFTNLIPTATLSKKIDDRQTLSVSYTKRLTRPYIWDLSPNVNASDPKNIISGNPYLQPELAHQAELAYNLNTGPDFFLNASFFWKQTDNAIVEFMRTDDQGISYTSKQNLAANKQMGLNVSSSLNVSPRWSLNGNLNLNYLDFKSGGLEIYRSGWATDVNINTFYKLPSAFTVQAFGEYNTRAVTLLGSQTGRYYYSFAVKKEIKKQKLTITVAAINPFNEYVAQSVLTSRPTFQSTVDNRYYSRALKFTLNWEFGTMFQQKERKKINNDDVNVQGKG
jgi:outer membrane receptor protein involved in Fe transport